MSAVPDHFKQLDQLWNSGLSTQIYTLRTNGPYKPGLKAFDFDALLHSLDRFSKVVKTIQAAVTSEPDSVALASVLPVETLCFIFGFLAAEDLLRATHVCSHWRHAALGYACLWGEHICAFPRLTPLILQRSEGNLITINCKGVGCHNSPRYRLSSLHSALAQSQRVQRIELWGSAPSIAEALSETTTEAPMLQSMELYHDSHYYIGRSTYNVSSSTFSGHVPQLRHLISDRICFPKEFLHRLTHFLAWNGALGYDCNDVLDNLSHLSSVEVLEVDDSFLWLGDIDLPQSTIVSFTSLRELFLIGQPEAILYLMHHLSFTRRIRIVLDCERHGFFEAGVAPYLPLYSTTNDPIFAGTLDGLSITSGESLTWVNIEAWHDLTGPLLATPLNAVKGIKDPVNDIDFCFKPWNQDHFRFCLNLLGTPCLQNITSLRLTAEASIPAVLDGDGHLASTVQLFIQLKSLRSCVVEGAYVDLFIHALGSTIQHGPRKLYDGLEEIVLVNYILIERLEQSLLLYARSRQQSPPGLQRIRLVNPLNRDGDIDPIDDLIQRLRGAGVADVDRTDTSV